MRVPRMYSSGAGAWLPLLALGVGWLMGVGCSPSAPTPAGAGKPPAPLPAAVLATNSYPAKGLVRSVDLSHRKVKITHENIPGYMPRMTMDFDVRDASNLAPLKPGDEVTFTVRATADDGWIEGLTVSAPAQAAASPSTNPPPAADRAVADSEPLFPGDPLPSIALTNELVRPVTFQQYRGQVVAFTFFYVYIAFEPHQQSEMLRQQGGFVPGIRPGLPTEKYFAKMLSRITVVGAFFLASVAVVPSILMALWSISRFPYYGTTLLIAVGVALETMRQIDSQLMMRNYEGFLKR